MRGDVAGAAVPSGLIAIRHFGAVTDMLECAETRCDTAGDPADIAMPHARISDALLRQQVMSAQRSCADMLFPRGRTACMQGRDAAGAPTQRTVTSARAA